MDIPYLLTECAPTVAPGTLIRIIQQESGGNHLAIGVNGGFRLKRQPRTYQEAMSWATWLIEKGYSIDMGLGQINNKNLSYLGLSVETVFKPCDNVRAASRVLQENYLRAKQRYSDDQTALRAALSAYNTGSFTAAAGVAYTNRLISIPLTLPKFATTWELPRASQR